MARPENGLHDKRNGLEYKIVGNYYLPNLVLNEPSSPIGRWGRMYGRYLKESHPARYNAMLLSGKLNSHLAQIDKQAQEQLDLIIRQMQELENVTEGLKASNQIEWVRRMNNIQATAEEIVQADLIYR